MDLPSVDGGFFIHAGKCFVSFFVIVVLLPLLCLSADAEEGGILQEQIGVAQLERSAPDEAQAIFGAATIDDYSDVPAMLEKLWTSITGQSHDLLFSALRSGAQIIAVSFLAAICCSLAESETVSLAGVLAVSFVAMNRISSCAAVGKEALHSLGDYSHVLLPCLCTASAASGCVTSAGAKYAASILVLDGVISVCVNCVMPFLNVYAGVILAGQVTNHPLLQSVGGLLKLGVKWSLILITTVFTLYLSVTGLLTGTVDAAAAKAAKTAMSAAIPVVGGILSDASSALLSGAKMLCAGIGVMGMLAVLAVCLIPYLTLGSHYLVFQISGSAVMSFCDKRIGSVIKELGSVYGFLLGMVGCVSIMLFVSVISLMKAVTL